jgi:hypothetical protein
MKMSNRGFLSGTAGKPKSIGTSCRLKNPTSVKDQIRIIEDSTGIMPGLPKEQYLQRNDPKSGTQGLTQPTLNRFGVGTNFLASNFEKKKLVSRAPPKRSNLIKITFPEVPPGPPVPTIQFLPYSVGSIYQGAIASQRNTKTDPSDPHDLWLNKRDAFGPIYKDSNLAIASMKEIMGPSSLKPMNNISKLGAKSKAFNLIKEMKLCELFDQTIFVSNLKRLPAFNDKRDFVDHIMWLRAENKAYSYEYGLIRLEPLLKRFIRNLKDAVLKRKEAKNEIVTFFL